MDKFQEIIDTYISNYNSYDKGKIDFECEYGEVIFYKDYKNPNILIIFGLYIKPEFREKGYCRSIFQYIIDKNSNTFKWLCIQSVISKVLYEYLLRFKYKNKMFYLKKDGFYLKL
jgi:hypothetical protein